MTLESKGGNGTKKVMGEVMGGALYLRKIERGIYSMEKVP
jgi:hypothetical protein